MARNALTMTAATLTATAAVLLTACGGGGDGSSQDDIKEAGSPPTPSGAERPVIKLPNTFQLTFADWKSTDTQQQALLDNGTTASLAYCTDESEARTKHRKTGKVEGNPPGMDPEVYYLVTLRKSSEGVWQNSSVRSERGKCAK
ncbi:hypothetical protein [Streptomyces sp. WAC 04229]|uniref:hypothetical protein n=1 Tax=Streptomyces sp. WAC 04229 TaxID=2203206 RepID=UPI003D748AC7